MTRPSPDFDRLVLDRLTGAHSYHYLWLRLEEELERTGRYDRPLALVLADVDELGAINDRCGRAAGDLVLQQVASILVGGARAVDRVGRWAGGAFALVLPETAVGAAYGLAERLRCDVAARRLESVRLETGEPQRITVSCGVAAVRKQGVLHLVARADQALCRAKSGGGNRSVVDG